MYVCFNEDQTACVFGGFFLCVYECPDLKFSKMVAPLVYNLLWRRCFVYYALANYYRHFSSFVFLDDQVVRPSSTCCSGCVLSRFLQAEAIRRHRHVTVQEPTTVPRLLAFAQLL